MTKLTDNYRALCQKIGLHDESFFDVVEFSKATVLFSPGDACQMFLIVLTGEVRVELTTKNGRVLCLYQIGAGENCLLSTSALLTDERYYTRGITESAVTALAIPSQKFHEALMSQTHFAKYVLEGFSTRMASIIGLVDRMAMRDVNASIASFLLENHVQQQVCITQNNLAVQIGTAREVISRKLSDMETQGIISRDKSTIKLVDIAALKKVAGFK